MVDFCSYNINTNSMSVYILEPVLTDEMLRTIFSKLTFYEVFRDIGMNSEGYEGMQTGYIDCLIDMFGESDEDTVENAFDEGKSWVQVVERITEHPRIVKMKERDPNQIAIEDFESLRAEIEQIVHDYLDEHIEDARIAIRSI